MIFRLNALEKKINDVKLAYERYFAGLDRREPLNDRDQLQRMVIALSDKYVPNTQLRFRLTTLINRFNSYRNLWDRICAEIEMGTYRPDRFKADLRVGVTGARSGASKEDESKPPDDAKVDVRGIFKEFLEARKRTNESTNITFEKFKESLDRQLPGLKERFKCGDVGFKVVIEDGRTKVKGYAKD